MQTSSAGRLSKSGYKRALEKELQGREIEKEFPGHGLFKGVISDIWVKDNTEWFGHVKYEDGDLEDLHIEDLRTLLCEYNADYDDTAKRKRYDEQGTKSKKIKKCHRPVAGESLEARSPSDGQNFSHADQGQGSSAKRARTKKEEPKKVLDPYQQGLQGLIDSGVLCPGPREVVFRCGSTTIYADLQVDGLIGYKGQLYVHPEDVVLSILHTLPAPAFESTKADGTIPGPVVSITVGGKPLEHWEQAIASYRDSRELISEDSNGLRTLSEDENMRKWLKTMEESEAALQALFEKDRQQSLDRAASATSQGHPGAANQLENLKVLKTCIRKLKAAVQVTRSDGPVPVAPRLDRDFTSHLLRLHFLPWLHAEIQEKVHSQALQKTDFQRILGESFRDFYGLQENTASTAELAGLADCRLQLKHMQSRARDILLQIFEREEDVRSGFVTAHQKQSSILQTVKGRESELLAQKLESERELRGKVQRAEAEEKALQAKLQKTRLVLSSCKEQLNSIAEVNDRSLGLLTGKCHRWEARVDSSAAAHSSVQERIKLLDEMLEYAEGIDVERPISAQLQHQLGKLSAWCCANWEQSRCSDRDYWEPRCKVRITYEFFSLTKRLFGGDVPVRVKDIARLQAAFQMVFREPESTVIPWSDLPVQACPAFPPSQPSRLLHVSKTGLSAYIPSEKPGQGTAVTEQEVRSNLTSPRVTVFAQQASLGTEGEGDDACPISLLLRDLSSANSSAKVKDSLLIFGRHLSLHAPPSMCEALLLAHSQDYICRLANSGDHGKNVKEPREADQLSNNALSLAHSGKPVSILVVPWWEELISGQKLQVARGALVQSLRFAAVVCHAVDLLFIIKPALSRKTGAKDPSDPQQQRPSTSLCLVDSPGHTAGRYGSRELSNSGALPSAKSMLNYTVIAMMYARIIWAARKVAIVDLGAACYGHGTAELLEGDLEAFYASLYASRPGLPRDVDSSIRHLQALPTEGGYDAYHESVNKLLSKLAIFEPEILIVSSGLLDNELTQQCLGDKASEETNWAIRQMHQAAGRFCKGRLLLFLPQPSEDDLEGPYQGRLQQLLEELRGDSFQ